MGQTPTKTPLVEEENIFWKDCENGDHESVLNFLEKNPTLLQKTYNNYYCIHWAIVKGHYGVTRVLLEKYPQLVNQAATVILDSSIGKAQPIHIASQRGHADILKLLIEHKADLRCGDTGCYTPLGVALTSGNYVCAKILINKGADIHYLHTDPSQDTIHLFHNIIDPDLLKLLLKFGMDPNFINPKTGSTILHSTITNYKQNCAEVLLSSGCMVNHLNNIGESPLHLAITTKRPELVKILISHRADCNLRNSAGHNPVQLAVNHHSFEVLNVLLEESTLSIPPTDLTYVTFLLVERVNNGTASAICQALGIILGSGFPVNEMHPVQGMTLLQIATRNNYCPVSIIELLLSHYADPNIRDLSQNTPLHQVSNSTQKLNAEKVKALLEAGADPNVQNSVGNTPLHLSVNSCNLEITQCLMNYGADFLQKEKNGKSVLQSMMGLSVFKAIVEGIRETNPEFFENLGTENISSVCPLVVGKICCWQCGLIASVMCYYMNNNEGNREDNFRVQGYSAVCMDHKEFGDAHQNWIFVAIN